MTTEAKEAKATSEALDQVSKYIKPGINEGISWTLSRLTEDLFGDSLLAGGDASQFTASGKRGTLHSQESNAYLLSPSGDGETTVVPITLAFDLNEGVVKLSWTPSGEAGKNVSFNVELDRKDVHAADGEGTYLFHAENASDGAGYSLMLELL
jgi:hypothetical protein